MLLEMRIENFILIEKLNISFSEKLNVFTGETGAGKSMIIGALNAGLGEKVSGDVIRLGAEKAVVQLVFIVDSKEALSILDDAGIELEDQTLIITREILKSNRSVIRMNGRMTTVSVLKNISSQLMDIHGQHAHQALLYPKHHLTYLDLMGNGHHDLLRKTVENSYKEIKSIQNSLDDLQKKDENFDTEYLKYQLNEIDILQLSEDDEDLLNQKFEYYKNIELIHDNIQFVNQAISSEDANYSIKDLLSRSIKQINEIASFDKTLEGVHEQLHNVMYIVDDVQNDLRTFFDNIEVDEKEMNQVESRVNAINALKLKHGRTVTEILAKREELSSLLILHDSRDNDIKHYEGLLLEEKKKYLKAAKILQESRLKIKEDFTAAVTNELKVLNMIHSTFDVRFLPNQLGDGEFRLSPYGFDQVEFMISTNPGMPMGSLSKIASGGEISRIMLAIKIALSNHDVVPSLVFDEVDTGISGNTALIVGEKIHHITENYQVLCITHLPQIAVMADQHFLLMKQVKNGITSTEVKSISNNDKLSEIARMLSGDENSKISIQNAEEMLTNAKKIKSIS